MITIIIVNYYVTENIHNIIRSITDLNSEVIIVDNSQDYIQLKTEKVVRNIKNIGYGAAVNQGVSLAKSKSILIMNPDINITGNMNKEIRNLVSSSGDLVIPEGNASFQYDLIQQSIVTKNTKQTHDSAVDLLGLWFLSCDKSRFMELNGFDERFFLYAEDFDFQIRWVKRYGRNTIVTTKTDIHHYSGGTSKSSPIKRIKRLLLSLSSNAKLLNKQTHDDLISRIKMTILLSYPRLLGSRK
jgi:GT2 family glycosyltransferase